MACYKFKISLVMLWVHSCASLTFPTPGSYSYPLSSKAGFNLHQSVLCREIRSVFESRNLLSMHLKGGGDPNLLFSTLVGFLKDIGGVASSAIVVVGCNLLGFAITLGTGTHLVTDLLGTGAIGISAAISSLSNNSPISCRSNLAFRILLRL